MSPRQFVLTHRVRAIDCVDVDEVHAAPPRVGQGEGAAPA